MPNVRLTGAYEPEDVAGLLTDIDILVVPSLWWETFCLTIREGQLAGVPVVADRTDTFTELIDDARSGLLSAPGDSNAVAKRLLRLYDDAHTAARIGAAGRELVETRFNPDVFATRLDEVYRQCRAGEPIRIAPDPLAVPQAVGSTARTDPGGDVKDTVRTTDPSVYRAGPC